MNIYDLINKMTLEHKTIFDMPLKVTFYARVSTHKDVQLNSQEHDTNSHIGTKEVFSATITSERILWHSI